MDGKRQSTKPTGIPRFSKLPVPRPTSLRPSPSREALITNGSELRNPRLRPAASREQLVTASGSSRKPDPAESPRLPSRESPRNRHSLTQSAGSTTKLFHQTTRNSLSRQPSGSLASAQQQHLADNPPPKKLQTPAPRPSRPFTSEHPSAEPHKPANNLEGISEFVGSESVGDDAVDAGEPTDDASAFGIRAPPLKSRPSLAERTIETLSQIPSSPAVKGRASAFYDPDSARKTLSRPGSRGSRPDSRPNSSHRSDGSNRPTSRQSRPSSSSGYDGSLPDFRSSFSSYKNKLSTIDGTPVRGRASLTPLKTPSTRVTPGGTVRSTNKVQPPPGRASTRSRTPSPEKRPEPVPTGRYGSKTVASRPAKARPSVTGLFKKPSMPTLDKSTPAGASRKASLASQRSSTTSAEDTNPSSASPTSTAPTVESAGSPPGATSRKSSAALREQIAKAKAAKRAASHQALSSITAPISEAPVIPTDTTFDFGLSADPFNQRTDDKVKTKMLQGRVESARTSGRLNIAAMGLREIPTEVIKMYDLESVGTQDGTWAESVDLTRFVAADNELEMIDEALFPDHDPEDISNEDSRGSIFGGLETLDLHGNMLICLPMGLRRLPLLTSLNLSQNRLANNCLEIISQITSLRDLKLGGNLLYGPLDPCFSSLKNLEILDLHGNNISSLPLNLEKLARLRILNISENAFEVLPFAILSKLPLTEILARKNQLSGTLIDETVEALPNIQSLDVSSNQLIHLTSTGKTVEMPALHQLCLSMNRLQGLPDMGSWSSLLTLTADENNINAIPVGMTSLETLRHVDFSSNDIRIIPPEVGRMENLAMLRLSGNPLRDKKFSNINTDELKTILAARLEPLEAVPADHVADPEPAAEELVDEAEATETGQLAANAQVAVDDERDQDSRSDMDDFATPPTSAPASPVRSRAHTLNGNTWPVKSGGVLDRSNTESSSLHPVICSKIAADNTIREIQLHHNLFTTFPESLSFFAETLTSLSMSHNQLVGETFIGGSSGNEHLALPALKELNLASNHITSLTPLTSHLRAPNLQKMDVSFNRISTMPQGGKLLAVFPSLTVLLISNNHLDELDPEAIKGLRIVDAANNDIAHLNPRIGLLGGTGGLERLEVMGNRFRVPRWNVLERGTEATLRWLRGRVPVAEMAEWKDQDGNGNEDTSLADLD